MASCVVKSNRSCAFKNTPSNINRTMNDVPDTGSIPVSPITLTAIAPSRNVVKIRTEANISDASIENPPMVKIRIIEKKVKIMNIGICFNGHSYHPFPSIYSWLPSPLSAPPISLKIFRKVLYILARPNIPPPTIAPIAIVLTDLPNASICSAAPVSPA